MVKLLRKSLVLTVSTAFITLSATAFAVTQPIPTISAHISPALYTQLQNGAQMIGIEAGIPLFGSDFKIDRSHILSSYTSEQALLNDMANDLKTAPGMQSNYRGSMLDFTLTIETKPVGTGFAYTLNCIGTGTILDRNKQYSNIDVTLENVTFAGAHSSCQVSVQAS